jgi:hypothetical protein
VTQFYRLVPSNVRAPTFYVRLDGVHYNLIVTWNLAAQRFYINLYDDAGDLRVATPLTETAPGFELAALEWDATERKVVVTLADPYWRPMGQIVEWTLQGCDPAAYNGLWQGLTLSPTQFSFPLDTDPGPTAILGSAHRYQNMIGPWFKTSTLIYRNSQFEINP